MKLVLAFVVGVLFFAVWEARGGPRWRAAVVLLACLLITYGFSTARLA